MNQECTDPHGPARIRTDSHGLARNARTRTASHGPARTRKDPQGLAQTHTNTDNNKTKSILCGNTIAVLAHTTDYINSHFHGHSPPNLAILHREGQGCLWA